MAIYLRHEACHKVCAHEAAMLTSINGDVGLHNGVACIQAWLVPCLFGRRRWSLSYHAHRKRVAVMVSKLDHCLYDLLVRHKSGAGRMTSTTLLTHTHTHML